MSLRKQRRYDPGMSQRPEPWFVDPADPRAPPQELWDRMSEAERQRVVRSLPSKSPINDAPVPDSDELISKLDGMVNQLEQKLAEALAEIERLKSPQGEG
jgi:hypothetical protein